MYATHFRLNRRARHNLTMLEKEREQNMNKVDLKPTFIFLNNLKQHNNKPWFDANRADYEGARARFENLGDQLIEENRKNEDLGGITAKDCVMQIYRDVRFSKDKSPYKTNMSASITPGGKKSSSHRNLIVRAVRIEPGL